MGPVEDWARNFKPAGRFDQFTPTAALHALFRDWEAERWARSQINIRAFSIKLGKLCLEDDFPWERRHSSKCGWEFRHRGLGLFR